MNREIKFRAWDKEDNRMFYDVMVGRKGNYIAYVYTTETDIDDDGEECDFEVTYSCFDNIKGNTILMQFTGLEDKNGRDIYDGSIVKHEGLVYEIFWNERNASFALKGKNSYSYFDDDILAKDCEIIGNIHQNSELL